MGDAAAFERRLHPDLAHRPFRREMAAVSVRSAVVHRSQREVRALHVQFCDATGGGRPDLKRSSIAADFPDLTWGTGSSTLRLYGPPVDACASSEVPPDACNVWWRGLAGASSLYRPMNIVSTSARPCGANLRRPDDRFFA